MVWYPVGPLPPPVIYRAVKQKKGFIRSLVVGHEFWFRGHSKYTANIPPLAQELKHTGHSKGDAVFQNKIIFVQIKMIKKIFHCIDHKQKIYCIDLIKGLIKQETFQCSL